MSLIILLLSKIILIGGYKVSCMITLLLSKVCVVFLKEQLMMLNVLLSIFIWFKLSLNKFLMCKKICLLIMPNRTYKLMELKLGVEHTPMTHSILRGIQRGSSKILKYKKKTGLLDLRRKRRRRNIRRLTIPMILLQVKSQLLILTAYLPPMLKQKTVPSLKKSTRRRMIHPKFEKKKHLINARS